MAPKSTHFEPILGSGTVLEASKSEENLTDNEREARSSVKTWEEIGWEMRNVGYVKQAQEQAQASEQQRAHKQAQASTKTAQASTRK